MIRYEEVMILLFCHFFVDYCCQPSIMALNKHKNILWLLAHTVSYTIAFSILVVVFSYTVGLTIYYDYSYQSFLIMMFLTHTLIDFSTSRISHHFYDAGNNKLLLITLGVDQLLHHITIFYYFSYFNLGGIY